MADICVQTILSLLCSKELGQKQLKCSLSASKLCCHFIWSEQAFVFEASFISSSITNTMQFLNCFRWTFFRLIKIHISQQRMSLYTNLPDMIQYFTTDGNITKLHACKWEKIKKKQSDLPCGSSIGCHGGTLKVLKIKPTTLWFARHSQPLPSNHIRYCKEKQLWRVVHSMHASMNEIRDMIAYLRPCNVYANVRPAGRDSLKDVVERLKDLINEDRQCDILNPSNSEDSSFINENKLISYDGRSSHVPITAKAAPSSAVSAKFVELGLLDEQQYSDPPPKRRRPRNPTGSSQTQGSVE